MCLVLKLDNGKVVSIADEQTHPVEQYFHCIGLERKILEMEILLIFKVNTLNGVSLVCTCNWLYLFFIYSAFRVPIVPIQ